MVTIDVGYFLVVTDQYSHQHPRVASQLKPTNQAGVIPAASLQLPSPAPESGNSSGQILSAIIVALPGLATHNPDLSLKDKRLAGMTIGKGDEDLCIFDLGLALRQWARGSSQPRTDCNPGEQPADIAPTHSRRP